MNLPRSDNDKPKGKSAVVVSIDDAERELQRRKPAMRVLDGDEGRDLHRQKMRREDPAPELPRGGVRPNAKGYPPNWKPNKLGLPSEDPCPVVPLGTEKTGDGVVYHMIDSGGNFVSYAASDFSHAGMQSLFALTPNYPAWAWPRHGKPYKVTDEDGQERTKYPIASFTDDDVRQALMQACSRQGLFSPTDKLRGRGMWLTKKGELIYHAGEELWIYDHDKQRPVALETGSHEGFLYPRFPSLPAPWPAPIAADGNPAGALLQMLRGPNWSRPEIDPVLLLGWIAVAYLGGALDWRSAVLLLGGFGTGKSTLQEDLKLLFGEALFNSADTTAAGIYQAMAHDTRPIALDELEPDADSRKVDNVVHLMRASASGAIGRRGSSGGQAGSYQMRSAFLFSAINNPLNSAQDMSRVAILRLQELRKDQKRPPTIDADTCGRMLLAMLLREWPRFHATRELYMRALGEGGHVARGQKTYGTLLAGADLMLGAELGDELGVPTAFSMDTGQENSAGLEWWSQHLAAAELPEVEDATQNWRKCLETILTSPIEGLRNGRTMTVGGIVEGLYGHIADAETVSAARKDLAAAGLGLLVPGEEIKNPDTGSILCVPNDHPLLKRLFRDSPWAAGGWKDALRQCPIAGVMITHKDHNRQSIGGVQMRCTLVSLRKFKEAPER